MSNKVVVITGASTGIGKVSALDLARKGYKVYAGVRKQADGEALQSEASGQLIPLILDVTNAEHLASAITLLTEQADGAGLHGLVNNAGVAVGLPIEIIPLDKLRWQLEVNVVGQVACTQAFLPLLRQARGRIVNISSVGGNITQPGVGAYSASKFGLEAISDALRIELAPWGIRVAVIQPGSIATPIWDKSLADNADAFAGLSAEARALYGEFGAKAIAFSRKTGDRGIPAQKVADAIHHALSAGTPKTRYRVGADAKLGPFLRGLPDTWRDALFSRMLELDQSKP